jgi:hypothetical protein
MVARDTGCRPHEIVNMKNKDLVIQRMDDGSHVAIVTVNGSFLTGKKNKVIIQIQYMYYQLVIFT